MVAWKCGKATRLAVQLFSVHKVKFEMKGTMTSLPGKGKRSNSRKALWAPAERTKHQRKKRASNICYSWAVQSKALEMAGLNDAFVWDAHEILPGLYLGSVDCMYCAPSFGALNIKGCVSVLNECEVKMIRPEVKALKIKWLHIPIDDDPGQALFDFFAKSCKFIEKRLSKGDSVLVHCWAGASRSVTLVCAYLVLVHKYDVDSALKFVKEKRSKALPNIGFLRQLRKFEENCKGRK